MSFDEYGIKSFGGDIYYIARSLYLQDIQNDMFKVYEKELELKKFHKNAFDNKFRKEMQNKINVLKKRRKYINEKYEKVLNTKDDR
jgi:hypothetical protein